MLFIIIIGTYLAIGFGMTLILSMMGEFDYTPNFGDMKPSEFKYVVLLLWPIVFIALVLSYLTWPFKNFNKYYNRLLKIE